MEPTTITHDPSTVEDKVVVCRDSETGGWFVERTQVVEQVSVTTTRTREDVASALDARDRAAETGQPVYVRSDDRDAFDEAMRG